MENKLPQQPKFGGKILLWENKVAKCIIPCCGAAQSGNVCQCREEMLVSSKCFLHSFLIVVTVRKHGSNKIPTTTPSVKGTRGVRNWRETGKPVLLYELFTRWVLLLPFPPSRRGCSSSPGCLSSSSALLPLSQRFGLNNPIKLCSLYNSLGLRQQPDWRG